MFIHSLNKEDRHVNRCRRHKAVYQLPQDIDVSANEAKLGVLTLKLAEGKTVKLAIN